MKRQNSLVLLASVMLAAMSLASCKSSNKPAADASATLLLRTVFLRC